MSLNNVLPMLLGAALVAIGVLAAALADRIRGVRPARENAPRARAAAAIEVVESKPERAKAPRDYWPREAQKSKTKDSTEGADGADDVIAALIGAGYKKPIATEAARACSQAERTTVEEWTRAALRRCVRGGMS